METNDKPAEPTDSEMLDWLAACGRGPGLANIRRIYAVLAIDTNGVCTPKFNGSNDLRAAIRAAMKECP